MEKPRRMRSQRSEGTWAGACAAPVGVASTLMSGARGSITAPVRGGRPAAAGAWDAAGSTRPVGPAGTPASRLAAAWAIAGARGSPATGGNGPEATAGLAVAGAEGWFAHGLGLAPGGLSACDAAGFDLAGSASPELAAVRVSAVGLPITTGAGVMGGDPVAQPVSSSTINPQISTA